MKSSVMKDIGERFVRYSMRFPDEVINAQQEIKIIETEIEPKFDEDLGNIKKIMNDKKLSISINFKEFENSIYLIKQALYTHTKVPEKSGDILRFYISNLYICKNVLTVIVRYIHQSIIDRLQRSFGDYEKRTNNVLIKDFHEFIGCSNNVDKIIGDYLTFYELIEVQLGVKTKVTDIKSPTRYEIIGGIKQSLINAAKTHDIMLSLVRLALEFVTLEEVAIKLKQRLKESQSYSNIKDIQFTKNMTSYGLFDIMRDMRLCPEDDKYVIERIYEWGSRSIHQGQIIPVSLIWYCLFYVEEDLTRLLRNQSELQYLENKELYEKLLKDGKIMNIYDYQTYIPSYYNKS